MKTKLLSNQIKKYLGQEELNNPKILAFTDAVSNSYGHYEKDRELLEKAMDLSSNELYEANSKLRQESQDNKIAIEKLKESLRILQDQEPENEKIMPFLKPLDIPASLYRPTGSSRATD